MTKPLDAEEQHLWHVWKTASEQVRQRVGDEIKAGTGLSDPDFGILTRLVELGGGELRQNDLGASMGWHRSRLSHQLTRMEERGLLRRRSVDGGVLVQVTEQGSDLVDVARPIHAAAVRKNLVDHVEGPERRALVQLLEALAGD
ncbi:MarR family transcriptional regulator [Curtobacterium sp. A7_M15]|jgi:DNA-binding MarR family transcriptional regulator|uniref:MarR family winged helix-turn-helix transcriptional regulator n=1 Tax=Curtobacterium sp. A7_M15 TaxID=3065241 RepID=UPI002737B4EF|nr:MarR family transcriptional regulator [Curtobacterium sp. A7_M15]MDP4333839.1 MarR family transcriptional regulator [Curtobacterium sp. A7_M15]